MTYHIQETIFPDRHTVAVMNSSTGEFLPVAEIRHKPGIGYECQSFRSQPGDTLESFAKIVARLLNPFERLRPSDYTGNLFD